MDALPPIRNMSLTQQRIRDALKNAPPLKVTKKSTNDDFIVFEDQKKVSNSLFERFLKHKNPINGSESKDTKKSVHKWTELKDQMTQELETKRMESQKFKDINDKIENEELEEEVGEELDPETDEEVDPKAGEENGDEVDVDSNKKDDQLVSQSPNSSLIDSDFSDDNEEDNSDEEEGEELMAQSDDSEEEEEESDREVNPFLDDEADDEEVADKVDRNLYCDSDESRDSFGINSIEKEPLAQKECDDNQQNNGLNDSVLNASFTSFESFNERKCATQKIALSPFITQRPKPRFTSEQFPELMSNLESNNEEFNSQSLLDLCSGNFIETVPKVNTQSESELENHSQTEDKPIDRDLDSDNESEEEVEEVIKSKRKAFNIDSDDEDDEHMDNSKSIQQIKSFNGSDGEELVVTEDEIGDEEVEEEEDVDEEQVEQNVKSFFDNEAELSGDDEVSSDEDDGEDDEHEEEDGDKEDLPSDSEIEDQNKRFFNKQILDEEKRNIMLWKERLFEDGDLHDGGQREKKFRWNFETDDNFVNDYINEDSDDNYMDYSDDEHKTKVPVLKFKPVDQSSEVDNKITQSLDKLKSNSNFDIRSLSRTMSSDSKSNSISSFIVRDERLKTIMSFNSKRTSGSVTTYKSNKKLKTTKKTKTSIFDLLKQFN